jgi:hypothetical protein
MGQEKEIKENFYSQDEETAEVQIHAPQFWENICCKMLTNVRWPPLTKNFS